MFSGFISALQGPAEEAVDDSETTTLGSSQSAPLPETAEADLTAGEQLDHSKESSSQAAADQHAAVELAADSDAAQAPASSSQTAAEQGKADARAAAAAPVSGQAFNLWGMASGLVDSVRKGTNELAAR